MKALFLLFLFPIVCYPFLIHPRFHNLKKREVLAQNFSNQDPDTVYRPLQCLQQCTEATSENNNDGSQQTIVQCVPSIQEYVEPLTQNSSLPPEVFQSVLSQLPLDDCSKECDPNNENIVGDLMETLKFFTNFACMGDIDDDDDKCFQALNQRFPDIQQDDILNARGNSIPCKLYSLIEDICPDSKDTAKAMGTVVNILTTLETQAPYTPIDKCN